ncbi:hypothetical protein YK48G_02890 [Lentilactobacillus fungorum]|jgi:exodeoxyribonuclease VII small subunit|uniref:Exodeoxyribonuclease 7 small subunit n=1 Tax=Lentilactobacillus fungorum TaxID=2201250 RepID=A0ABQ3VYW8_9LACO|nr:exodeoxyribonuclease VII small subunit [Lentilactobacillus fungorum]GHP12864.1 hypothetical protein YK48G_02890 [Lentilactobacillus fungorum]
MADQQDNQTFEQKMAELEKIVTQLEQGNVSLEDSMEKFKTGIQLSEQLQTTLTNAEHTMAKMMAKDGSEVPFEGSDKQSEDGSDDQQS